jgi:hypothetical protein
MLSHVAGRHALADRKAVISDRQLWVEGTRSPELEAPMVGSGATRESGMA